MNIFRNLTNGAVVAIAAIPASLLLVLAINAFVTAAAMGVHWPTIIAGYIFLFLAAPLTGMVWGVKELLVRRA